jgi:phage terminase large subunit-like protein
MKLAEITDADLERYAKDFIAWSESPIGFYPGKRFDQRRQRWLTSREPITWVPRQRRWIEYALARNEKGDFLRDEIWCIDIGKSGKTMLGAALAQWRGMFSDLPGEVLLAANAKQQSKVRTYAALLQSIRLSPAPFTEAATRDEIKWRSGNVARPVPLNAETQAGSDPLMWHFDEVWAYTTDTALAMFSEAKSAPTQNVSLRVITTYPGYFQDAGPLNEMLKSFFDEENIPRPGVKRPIDDLPIYEKDNVLVWWNHEPYPWHLREISGLTFLQRERRKFKGRENEYKRIWQAQVVSKTNVFIHPVLWHQCEDEEHRPLAPEETGRTGVLGFDIGWKRDSSAGVFRGYNLVDHRRELQDHRIWRPVYDPDRPGEPPEVKMASVASWVINHIRQHNVLAVYYDQTQAASIVQEIEEAIRRMNKRTKLVSVDQGKLRAKGDMHYYDLIADGLLRNYPQCGDLTQHVLDASARYTRSSGDFRLDKRVEGIHIDGAVADAMCCLGILENISLFRMSRRVPLGPRPHPNPYRRIYQGR